MASDFPFWAALFKLTHYLQPVGMLIRPLNREHDGMARPSGGGDGRGPRSRPSNGLASGATRCRRMRELCCAWRCDALIAEIAAAGRRAIAVAADVAQVAAVEAMAGRTETELGPVTILVNNAGVAWQGTLDTYDREQLAHAPGKRRGHDPRHARGNGRHAGGRASAG
jgi:short chain dehydrogenase